jgi:hypothetical protein
MCPLPQQIPIAETSKASTGCPVQDKITGWGQVECEECEQIAKDEVRARCALPAC